MAQPRDTGRTRVPPPYFPVDAKPSPSPAQPRPSRRGLLAGVSAALVAGATIATAHGAEPPVLAPSPDAELLALCAQFIGLESRIIALYQGPTRIDDDDARDAAIEPLETAQEPIVGRICATPARTAAGIQAKAKALTAWAPDMLEAPENGYWNERLLAALLADLTGRTWA